MVSIFPHLWVLLQGPVPPAARPGAPIHILQCRCRCSCRCMCKCSCRCRFMFRCRYYPCGYLHGGRVKVSDGECCSKGGLVVPLRPGAGPPAQVRPTAACPVPRRRSLPIGPPCSRCRSGPTGPSDPPAQVRPTRLPGPPAPVRPPGPSTPVEKGCLI